MYHSSFSPPDCQIEHYSESEYMQRRNKEELSHKDWMKQRKDLEKKIQEKLEENIKVQSSDNRVKFIYKCKGHEVLDVTIFRFKIILVYYSLLRKWYISPGYSFVPEVIDLRDKLKSGTNDPFSEKVLNIIHGVKYTINAFMKRLTDVYQFVHDAQERNKDVQFAMNAIVTKMKLTFTENAWPNDLQKSSAGDTIVVELKLNKNIQVCNVGYEYIQQKPQIRTETAKNINKLESMLQNFFHFPLEEAFERFIIREEESTSSQEEESENRLEDLSEDSVKYLYT
ncbi:uncharacterized protein LOC112455315 [Temnothorax curvispinosus]|uniref:Uncharacterized protein LOC112455315 n=1 Tax=Temnothorax curvispinosus TaxID=300111 RepID=A0A6J1PUB4_9HYME|nr:uncharacterized protein LOC112455315 [Temnothorax curvispinosus]